MRYLPYKENEDAGRMWKGVCFVPHVKGLSTGQFLNKFNSSPVSKRNSALKNGMISQDTEVKVNVKPYFAMSFEHEANPPLEAGMRENKCWPKKLAPNDPGFALWSWDEWYDTEP